jgi:hypothetical protein
MTCSKEVHQEAVASKTALQWPMTPESQEEPKQKHDRAAHAQQPWPHTITPLLTAEVVTEHVI